MPRCRFDGDRKFPLTLRNATEGDDREALLETGRDLANIQAPSEGGGRAGGAKMRSGEFRNTKRSINIGGRKTSVSLEEPFWTALKEIAKSRPLGVSELITIIDQGRGEQANLSSAIRIFVLSHFQEQSTARNRSSTG